MAQEYLLPVSSVGGYTLLEAETEAAAPDAYNSGSTYTKSSTRMAVAIKVLSYAVQVAFFDGSGAAMSAVACEVGVSFFPLQTRGCKVQNKTAGQTGTYQVIWYS